MKDILKVFISYRIFCCLVLGIMSGLPLALSGSTIQAWMTKEGINIKTIANWSLVGMAYSLKFIWAPLLDNFTPSFVDRRKFWMLLSQLLLVCMVLAVSFLNINSEINLLIICAALLAFFSATLDIAIDAYRTELLEEEERGAGSSVAVLGYRIGMIVSGAGALILADYFSWQEVYRVMAIFIFGLSSFIFFLPKVQIATPAKNFRDSVVLPFKDFFRRPCAIEILAFLTIYKVGDVMASQLTTPFMIQLGFSLTEIGAVTKGLGLVAAIVGGLVGGAIMSKISLKTCLIYFGITQALSTFLFAILALTGKNYLVMSSTIMFENFTAGLGTAAFIALIMGLVNKKYTATQFALLTSLATITGKFSGFVSGPTQENFGWFNFFTLCTLCAIPGIIMVSFRYDSWRKNLSEAKN